MGPELHPNCVIQSWGNVRNLVLRWLSVWIITCTLGEWRKNQNHKQEQKYQHVTNLQKNKFNPVSANMEPVFTWKVWLLSSLSLLKDKSVIFTGMIINFVYFFSFGWVAFLDEVQFSLTEDSHPSTDPEKLKREKNKWGFVHYSEIYSCHFTKGSKLEWLEIIYFSFVAL